MPPIRPCFSWMDVYINRWTNDKRKATVENRTQISRALSLSLSLVPCLSLRAHEQSQSEGWKVLPGKQLRSSSSCCCYRVCSHHYHNLNHSDRTSLSGSCRALSLLLSRSRPRLILSPPSSLPPGPAKVSFRGNSPVQNWTFSLLYALLFLFVAFFLSFSFCAQLHSCRCTQVTRCGKKRQRKLKDLWHVSATSGL
ncbi:hypothetical protein Mapa_014352 [Marchantia paleacea]|nr:hypothetical protein Mapa_014352 [Marchantia paleacea]